ncbi:FadR/GntR family transcriptional regulator [Nannocystis radixulma]|uniref:FadR/GntR family transcriptional regulator n=1 Tax=Nannocystis radixulma TaxID=2995305 RepID=A0ABT5B9K5_9BACT|nr:FadR/GntR family transcriptional regulator [Nannocystis radixulma]MDC0670300.1 FadR/GntR family transcriptional regulator [Nannocystis radixulma]
MRLKPVARKSLSDAVFEQLSQEIVHGRMRPGAPLPSERALCDVLRVNRGAVREALKRLSQAGLIAIQHGGGTRVLDFKQTASLDLLNRLLFHHDGTVDLRVARSVMEMRAAMAPDIARLAALRRSPGQVLQLDEVVAAMAAQEHDLLALQVLALQFWDLLTVCSENIAYQLAFNGLRHSYEGMREALVEVMGEELRDLSTYRRIADAVRRRDGEGAGQSAQALMQHGSRGILQLLAALETSTDQEEGEEDEDDDDPRT